MPNTVQQFVTLRSPIAGETIRTAAWLKWKQNPLADGDNIYWGKDPEKLYGSIMVYGANQYYFTGMDLANRYYFWIEAFNSAGLGAKNKVVRVK